MTWVWVLNNEIVGRFETFPEALDHKVVTPTVKGTVDHIDVETPSSGTVRVRRHQIQIVPLEKYNKGEGQDE